MNEVRVCAATYTAMPSNNKVHRYYCTTVHLKKALMRILSRRYDRLVYHTTVGVPSVRRNASLKQEFHFLYYTLLLKGRARGLAGVGRRDRMMMT